MEKMSFKKKLFGIFLIIFSSLFIFVIGFLNQFLGNSSGKVELNKKISLNEINFLKNSKNFSLVYFGYVGCDTICMPSLIELNKLKILLDKSNLSDIDIYFVNIQPTLDKDIVDTFAKSFNNNFMGIYLNNEELKKISYVFNLKYSNVLLNNYEVEHTGYLYLVKKSESSFILLNMYTNRPFDIENISKDLLKLKK